MTQVKQSLIYKTDRSQNQSEIQRSIHLVESERTFLPNYLSKLNTAMDF